MDRAADTEALRTVVFESMVRARLGVNEGDGELDSEDYAATVKAMFDESFPPGTEGGTPLPPPPPMVTPPPPADGVVERMVDALTLKTRREQQAVEAENARRAVAYAAALEMIAGQGLPLEEMAARLTARVEVPPGELRKLALARAAAVRDHFVVAGQVGADRVILAQSEDPARQTSGAKTFLELQ